MAVLGGGAKAHGEEEELRSGPRIVSDNDRCTLLIVDSWLPPYASPSRSRCFRCREKAKTGSSLPRWPFRRRKARRQTHASGPATTIATKDTPRAIVLVHAAERSRRFPKGIGHSPAQMPLMQDQGRISFGRLSSLPASSFQMMRAGHASDSKAMGQAGGGSPQLQLSAPYAHRPAQPSPARGYLSHTSTPN